MFRVNQNAFESLGDQINEIEKLSEAQREQFFKNFAQYRLDEDLKRAEDREGFFKLVPKQTRQEVLERRTNNLKAEYELINELKKTNISLPSPKNEDFKRLPKPEQEEIFNKYARQQQQQEIAELSLGDRAYFWNEVNKKEQEALIQLRIKNLKEEYQKQFLTEINGKLSFNSTDKQPSLTKKYIEFNKEEKAKDKPKNWDPNSGHSYKAWSIGEASDEYQIQRGRIPTRGINHLGVDAEAIYFAECRKLEVEKIVGAEKAQLEKAGFSPRQIERREKDIRKKAINEVEEHWKKEFAGKLEAWKERKAEEALYLFAKREVVRQQFQNLEPVKVEVDDLQPSKKNNEQSLSNQRITNNDLKIWYDNARDIGKSEEYLNGIKRTIEEHKQGKPLSETSIKEMGKDAETFQAKYSEIERRYVAKFFRAEKNTPQEKAARLELLDRKVQEAQQKLQAHILQQISENPDKDTKVIAEGKGLSVQERAAYFREKYSNDKDQSQDQNKQWEISK